MTTRAGFQGSFCVSVGAAKRRMSQDTRGEGSSSQSWECRRKSGHGEAARREVVIHLWHPSARHTPEDGSAGDTPGRPAHARTALFRDRLEYRGMNRLILQILRYSLPPPESEKSQERAARIVYDGNCRPRWRCVWRGWESRCPGKRSEMLPTQRKGKRRRSRERDVTRRCHRV
jgi:hypothetical protein